jgi:hypothetical protein
MDQVGQIEEAILVGCGLHETNRKDLHITIRIAKDFYDFLSNFGECPKAEQIDYISGTIRSGIDEFYLLAYSCRSHFRANLKEAINPLAQWDFPHMRQRFMSIFEHLIDSHLSCEEKLASLFLLTHIELAFMAQNFPFAIFLERPSDSLTVDEIRQDIDKMLGGNSSFSRKSS